MSDLESRIRFLEGEIAKLRTKPIDLQGRKFARAGTSSLGDEFVTRKELKQFQDTQIKRVQAVAELVHPGDGSLLYPGPLTAATLVAAGQVEIRRQVWTQFEFNGNAPLAADFRDFDGVEIEIIDQTGTVIPKGHFPVDVEPEGAFEIKFEHLSPDGDTNVTWYVDVRVRNPQHTAPPDVKVRFELLVAPKNVFPYPPTGVTLTPTNIDDYSYILDQAWVKPAIQGGVVGYERVYEFSPNSSGTPIDYSTYPGRLFGYNTESAQSDPSPRPEAQTYGRLGVRSYNAYEQVSEWVYSDWEEILQNPNEVIPQPGAGDWSITQPTNENGGYRADVNGNQFARTQVVISSIPAGADYVQGWLDIGNGYEAVWAATSASTVDHWVPQPTSAENWPIKLTASTFKRTVFPGDDTVHPPKTFNIAAWQKALPLVEGTVTLQELTQISANGKKRYRLKHTAVGVADPNRQAIRVYRQWTDETFTPVSGDDGTFKNISGVDATVGTSWTWFSAEIEGFEAPNDGNHYNRIAYVPLNHANQENWTDALYFNITFTPDGGFKANGIDPSTLGKGVNIIGGKLVSTTANAGLSNGNFDAGLNDWTVSSNVSIITGAEAYQGNTLEIAAGLGGDPFAYQTVEAKPDQILRLSAYAKSNVAGSADFMFIQWFNTTGALMDTKFTAIDSASYTTHNVVETAPANTGFARVGFYIPSGSTSGFLRVDSVVLTIEEPVAGGVKRDSSGITIDYNTSEFSISGTTLTVNGVPMTKATGFDTTAFEISSGAFRVKEIAAEKIVTGTLGVGVIFAGAIAVSQLTAGTATFSSDVEFTRTGGNKVAINSSGVDIVGGGSTVRVTASGTSCPVFVTATSGTRNELSQTAGLVIASGGITQNNGTYFAQDASVTLSLLNASAWRTALGLGTMAVKNIGVSGSFTTTDGKTIIITDGIVTSIV